MTNTTPLELIDFVDVDDIRVNIYRRVAGGIEVRFATAIASEDDGPVRFEECEAFEPYHLPFLAQAADLAVGRLQRLFHRNLLRRIRAGGELPPGEPAYDFDSFAGAGLEGAVVRRSDGEMQMVLRRGDAPAGCHVIIHADELPDVADLVESVTERVRTSRL